MDLIADNDYLNSLDVDINIVADDYMWPVDEINVNECRDSGSGGDGSDRLDDEDE